jgi:hypothetical protein
MMMQAMGDYGVCDNYWGLKWLKFIELSMAMIMGNIEDERCLINLGFMKNKLRNKLTSHLVTLSKCLFKSSLH